MTSEQSLTIGISLLCLAVAIPFLNKLFKKLFKWAEKEDEKNKHCPKCGKLLKTDDVKANQFCTIFYYSCPGSGCGYKDEVSIPKIEISGFTG